MRTYDEARTGAVNCARRLRRDSTDAERLMWRALRSSLPGFKWRRQLPIGPYFADLACFAERLIIELDGSQHADSQKDRRRDAVMFDEGWSVLRVWNVDVPREKEAVLETILAALEHRLNCDVAASDLRFIAYREYRERIP